MTDYWTVPHSQHGHGFEDRRVHTDEDCTRLGHATTYRPATEYEVETYDVCAECREGLGGDVDADWSAYRALRDAESSEVAR